MIIRSLKLLLLSLLACACTYEPGGQFYKAIDPNKDPHIVIALNQADPAVPIPIYETTSFTYDVSVGMGNVKGVNLLLDDKPQYNLINTRGSFTLFENNLKTGTTKLTLQVTSSSGTGSLADMYDGEIRITSLSWTLNIDLAPIKPLELSTSVTSDGFLKVSWTPYLRNNFSNYKISAFTKFGGFDTTAVITDPAGNFFIDKRYTGNVKRSYNVYVTTKASAGGVASIDVDGTFTVTGEIRVTDTATVFKWRRARFAGAFRKYSIRRSTDNVVVYSTTNVNDTTHAIKEGPFVFGAQDTYYVDVFDAKAVQATDLGWSVGYLPGTPKLVPRQDYFKYNKTVNASFGYIFTNTGITRYDASFTPAGYYGSQGNTIVPYENVYVYYAEMNYNTGIARRDLTNGNIEHIDLSTHISGGTMDGQTMLSASKDGIVIISYRLPAGGPTRVMVYDVANDVVRKDIVASSTATYSVSDDGRYLSIDDLFSQDFYQFDGTTYVPLWTGSGANFTFRPDNSDELIFSNGASVEIYSTVSGALLRTINNPLQSAGSFTFARYDPATKKILFTLRQSRKAYVVDIDTGVGKSINVFISQETDAHLSNGYFINYEGAYFKIP